MLLLYQAGSVKVGEVARYTLTYTPEDDRILPLPSHLHVRVKNTTAIPLRAAFLHGPYQLHCATYPSTFNPYRKFENPKRDGIPQFEPNLKAGSHWYSVLKIPEDVRDSADPEAQRTSGVASRKSVTWIVEVASQILFSATATVHFEILVGRDERSLDVGFAAAAGKGYGEPGQLQDHLHKPEHGLHRPRLHTKGVYSSALKLKVEDTEALWDKPSLPARVRPQVRGQRSNSAAKPPEKPPSDRPHKKQKVHLVVVTHGLHSNVGADMLFLKESIDATAKKAREERRKHRQNSQSTIKAGEKAPQSKEDPSSTAPLSGGQEDLDHEDPDEEQVVVRGFSGNAIRTEKGIQYLGKRLAKYILNITYPDQPFVPHSKSLTRQMTGRLSMSSSSSTTVGDAAHSHSSIHKAQLPHEDTPYTFTSISFIGHSLGGLIQTYAIAYIQKHSPEFFQTIKPVNFITLASPLLGLSNENPMYVRFALDFGLVGRTGQDLGLTWKPPTLARSGWNAMLSGLGGGNQSQEPKQDPRAKPLLRILPTGPAHTVLKMFKNRTVYSNVVNDGVVPLRTSCLLFLDWRGLEKVEGARRENGLLATMASFGWNELTGQNANTISHRPGTNPASETSSISEDDSEKSTKPLGGSSSTAETVDHAQAAASPLGAALVDQTSGDSSPDPSQFLNPDNVPRVQGQSAPSTPKASHEPGPIAEFLNFFKPASQKVQSAPTPKVSRKAERAYRRAQTIRQDSSNRAEHSAPPTASSPQQSKRPVATRGDSMLHDPATNGPPPTTSIFEAAGDIINPPIPTEEWLLDPSSRDRTIFHDRIYHPEDIPAPPPKRSRLARSFSSDGSSGPSFSFPPYRRSSSVESDASEDSGGMRVEEKIARAYHRDLSWRKVLVRLQPDAHNNMIVRRMFANAYGWDVVKHLCDTHFASTYAAETADSEEAGDERALPDRVPLSADAEQVRGQTETTGEFHRRDGEERDPAAIKAIGRTHSEQAEADDEVTELRKPTAAASLHSATDEMESPHRLHSEKSDTWDDRLFEGTDDDDTDDNSEGSTTFGPFAHLQRLLKQQTEQSRAEGQPQRPLSAKGLHPEGTAREAAIADVLTHSPIEAPQPGGLGILDQIYRDMGTTMGPRAGTEPAREGQGQGTGPHPEMTKAARAADTTVAKPNEAHTGP